MADNHEGVRQGSDSAGNKVQDPAVHKLPGSGEGHDLDVVGVWYFNPRAYLLHNFYVRAGKRCANRCGLCRGSVAKAVRTMETFVPSEPVVPSDRADSEGPAPLSSGGELWDSYVAGSLRDEGSV